MNQPDIVVTLPPQQGQRTLPPMDELNAAQEKHLRLSAEASRLGTIYHQKPSPISYSNWKYALEDQWMAYQEWLDAFKRQNAEK